MREAVRQQEPFTRQSPQRLKALREHAIVESAVSSNRIEAYASIPPASKRSCWVLPPGTFKVR